MSSTSLKRTILAVSIAAFSSPALVFAGDDYNKSSERDQSAGMESSRNTGTGTGSAADRGMGAGSDTGTSGTGTGSSSGTMNQGTGTGTGTTGTTNQGTGTMNQGTDDGMGTSTGTGTYGTGMGDDATQRDEPYQTDRNTNLEPGTTADDWDEADEDELDVER